MLSAIIGILVFVLLGFLIMGFGRFLLYQAEEGKKYAAVLIISFVLLVIIYVLSMVSTYLHEEYSKDKTTCIIPIEEITKVSSNSYIIKDAEQNIYNVVSDDIAKGDSNYIIHSYYPNLTGLQLFWSGLNKDTYTIVVTDINIPNTKKLSK